MPMKRKLHLRWRWLITMAGLLTTLAGAEEFNNVEYLCCDWGPAMTLPTKTNATAQFSDAEDEVYFLKQVTSFTRRRALLVGRAHNTIHGVSIWLCKMKADGSGRTEIKQLWKNPAYSIDTQDQNTWMDVNRKTRKLAFTINYGGGDITGLWTVNLDGSGLKELINPAALDGHPYFNSPCWTPDGEWIFFEETLHKHPDRNSIFKCNASGSKIIRVLEATGTIEYTEPRVSPDGKRLAFSRYPNGNLGDRFIWTSNLDGKDAAPLGGKDSSLNWGSYPAWSPDGKELFLMGTSCGIVDAGSGKELAQQLGLCGWSHWGRLGLIGYNVGGILLTDIQHKGSTWLGESRSVSHSWFKPDDGRW